MTADDRPLRKPRARPFDAPTKAPTKTPSQQKSVPGFGAPRSRAPGENRREGNATHPSHRPAGHMVASAEPLQVGGARNAQGTRVARRVECNRCGAIDHVSFTKKDAHASLCGVCARELLKIYEVGERLPEATRDVVCNLCDVPFELSIKVEDDGDLLCRNCLQEMYDWQGCLDMPLEERQHPHSDPRRAGVRLRRSKE